MKTKSILKWILILFVLVGFVAAPLGAVQAQEGGGEEAGVKLAVPGVPVLVWPNGYIFPFDNWSVDDPEYNWDAVSGATSYDLAVYASGVTTPIISKTLSSSICHDGSCLYQAGVYLWSREYKWRVRAKNSSGAGTWSAYKNFSLSSDPLVAQWPSGATTMVRPTFKWYKVYGAPNYQLVVYSNTLGKNVLDILVSRTYCGGSICAFTPNIALSNGSYKWKYRWNSTVRTSAYSAYKTFTVSKNGFNSEFNGTASGWTKRPGASWGFYNNAYYYSNGMVNKVSTTSYKTSYSNFVFTARMKRVSSEWGRDYGLIIRGNPTSVSTNYDWKTGYYFGIDANHLRYLVCRIDFGCFPPLQPYTSSDYIRQNDWNILRVVANGNVLAFYINDHPVWTETDATFSSGYVGLKLWTGGTTSERLYVDWATLGVLPGGVGVKAAGYEIGEIDPLQAKLNAEALKNPKE